MKKVLLLFILFINAVFLYPQSNFSPRTKLLFNSLNRDSNRNSVVKISDKFSFHNKNNIEYVNALIKVNDSFDRSFFQNETIEQRSSAENIISVSIPLSRLSLLAEMEGVEYVSIDNKIKTRLDNASADTRTLLVHTGFQLPYPVTGEGVVVGVIDVGFDYTHPQFYYSADSLRISRVWEQTAENGTPPAGYGYGNELVGKSEIIAMQKSPLAEYESHGTHVSGIAAGSGYLTNGKYTGAAPGSEIVLVEVRYGESDIIDAVAYIFNYAESVGKPAVINMSLGSHFGPHDGTSLLDQAFDILQGDGKILAGAAGNEGDQNLHIMKSSAQDSVRTIPLMLFSGMNPGYLFGDMSIWGDESPVSVRFTVIDTTTKQVRAVSQMVNTQNSEYEVIDLYYNGEYLAAIEVSMEDGSFNGKHNMYVSATVKEEYYLVITLAGNGTVHGWNLSDMPFSDIDMPQHYTAGDNNYSIGEVGGTGVNVISTGAYTTKNSFINLDGQQMNIPFYSPVGSIASFTSMGPTVDGRTKPDISAPGNTVSSSVSSFDLSFTDPIYQQLLTDKVISGSNEWFYAIFQGTSMSSPMTSGIIALMLEVNPQLNASSIKNIFKTTARQDEFTGSIPTGGSNLWGFGKIDAYASVVEALNSTDVNDDEELPNSFYVYNNFPNPFNPSTSIKFSVPVASQVTVSVYNILGEKVADMLNEVKSSGTYTMNWDAKNYSSGTYICRVNFSVISDGSNYSKMIKMILMK